MRAIFLRSVSVPIIEERAIPLRGDPQTDRQSGRPDELWRATYRDLILCDLESLFGRRVFSYNGDVAAALAISDKADLSERLDTISAPKQPAVCSRGNLDNFDAIF